MTRLTRTSIASAKPPSRFSTRAPRRIVRQGVHLVTVLAMTFSLMLSIAAPAYAAAGDIDPTFGSSGIVNSNITGDSDYVRSVIVQPDGKILVGGTVYIGDWTYRSSY